MRIATRLLLTLGAVLVLVMTAYGVYAQRQREALLGEAHLRDTEMMARLVAGVLSDAVRDDRLEDVGPLLERAREHPEVVALALVDPAGEVAAGELPGRSRLGCLASAVEAARSGSAARGTAECESRVDWAAFPAGVQGASLLVARRATALEREVAAARRQVVAVTIVLTLLGGAVIVLILRRTLSRPLDEMLEAVDRFGDPRFDDPVSVPEYPGELGELAGAFNDLDRRLEEKKKWIVREVEERLSLEGRLRRAERFAAAGRIVGGLAHELGSPLNVIGVRAEAVLGDEGVSDETKRHAQEIVDEVDRIAALVRSLSHMDRNGGLDVQEVDLVETVRGVARDLGENARDSGVEVVTELPDEPMVVRGDPALLRLAVRNLAANALQAVREGDSDAGGEIRLRVSADGPTADRGQDDAGDRSQEHAPRVRVEVEDDGPGIPPDVLPHIFEPFFTTKEVGQGTGLGLSTALGIAERHGGELRVESEPGEGARAILTLSAGARLGSDETGTSEEAPSPSPDGRLKEGARA